MRRITGWRLALLLSALLPSEAAAVQLPASSSTAFSTTVDSDGDGLFRVGTVFVGTFSGAVAILNLTVDRPVSSTTPASLGMALGLVHALLAVPLVDQPIWLAANAVGAAASVLASRRALGGRSGPEPEGRSDGWSVRWHVSGQRVGIGLGRSIGGPRR